MIKGETHDSKVDIWGVGILAYELATGSPPFEEISHQETYYRITQG